MNPIQTRLDNAIRSHERAQAEVERLCDIIEKAAVALQNARRAKRIAQRELDEAAKAASAVAASSASGSSGDVGGAVAGGRNAGASGGLVAAALKKKNAKHSNVDKAPEKTTKMPKLREVGMGNSIMTAALHNRQSMLNGERNGDAGGGGGGGAVVSHDLDEYSDEEDEDDDDYVDEEGSEDEEDSDEDSEADEDENTEDEDGFDVGNEALEQIRYRLNTAKIDPNSPEGTKLLDELLLRLQTTEEAVIDADLVNKFIDELLLGGEDPGLTAAECKDATAQTGNANEAERQNNGKPPSSYVSLSTLNNNNSSNPVSPQQSSDQSFSRIRIVRGNKVLWWYEGQLDKRGYAREGSGSMYYDAGHECHGTWENDEMIGRGIYKWADGHVYDGEWLNGKRHGLGRFIRPDGVVLYGRYEKGHHKGEGVRWSADRREAQVVVDGVPKKTVGLLKAEEIARDLGFEDVPPE